MSILIKGMRMPENCIKCPMQFGGMCYVMPAEVDESRVAPTVEEAWKQGKPDWCPLIEIPDPHGALIDRDALKNIKFTDTNHDYRLGWNEAVESIMENADAIIEGSEDDADD